MEGEESFFSEAGSSQSLGAEEEDRRGAARRSRPQP